MNRKTRRKQAALTRGRTLSKETLREFIGTLEIPIAEKRRLIKLTPRNYLGKAASLAKQV